MPVGDRSEVVLSLPSGSGKVPWARVDIETGAVDVARGLRGDVRDGLLDADGGGWLLTNSALVRVEVADRMTVVDTLVPKGMGKHQSRLHALGDNRYGACNWMGKRLYVVDVTTSALVKTINVVAPHLSVLNAETVTLYAPHGGERLVLGRGALDRLEHTSMPTGTMPFYCDGEIVMLTGERIAMPHINPTRGWIVSRQNLVLLDAASLTERRSAAAPRGARDVLGTDHAGQLVISTDDGVVIADRRTLKEIDRVTFAQPVALGAHTFLTARQAVVMTNGIFSRELIVARW